MKPGRSSGKQRGWFSALPRSVGHGSAGQQNHGIFVDIESDISLNLLHVLVSCVGGFG
jgi:hypothetical protein